MHLRTIWNGYVDMGRSRVPLLPTRIIMEDRDDGTQWLLTHSSDGEYVGIESTLPAAVLRGEGNRYGPYEGPYLRDGGAHFRLFVRGGYLGVDYRSDVGVISDQDNAAVMTRRGNENRYREIVVPTEDVQNFEGETATLAWVNTKDL